MEVYRPLRTVLCVYEGLRFVFLTGAFIVLQPEGDITFPWLALTTPGAFFLLMALFWRIALIRYRVYCPLYLAGKGLSILTTMLWLFFLKSDKVLTLLTHHTAAFIVPGIIFFLLLGDLISVWLVIKIIKVSEQSQEME